MSSLQDQLQQETSLNARERILAVSSENEPLDESVVVLRAEMRLHNLWHRATYMLVYHVPTSKSASCDEFNKDTSVLVQRRSQKKDYCPGRLDPTPGGVVAFGETYEENAIREIEEEMGIQIDGQRNTLKRLFSFPYQDKNVKVWGEFYECVFRGDIEDLTLQESEVEEVIQMPLQELLEMAKHQPELFMPDACHALRIYSERK